LAEPNLLLALRTFLSYKKVPRTLVLSAKSLYFFGTFKFGSAEFLVVRRYVVALVVFLFTLKSSKNFNSFGKKFILFWI